MRVTLTLILLAGGCSQLQPLCRDGLVRDEHGACVEPVEGVDPTDPPTEDTDDPHGFQAMLREITLGCSGSGLGSVWALEAETEGWAREVWLDIADDADTERYEFNHTVQSVAHDPGGDWDRLARELRTVDVEEAVVPGLTTLFDCEAEARLRFALRVHDVDGALIDCALWGSRPRRWRSEPYGRNGVYYAQCRVWND